MKRFFAFGAFAAAAILLTFALTGCDMEDKDSTPISITDINYNVGLGGEVAVYKGTNPTNNLTETITFFKDKHFREDLSGTFKTEKNTYILDFTTSYGTYSGDPTASSGTVILSLEQNRVFSDGKIIDVTSSVTDPDVTMTVTANTATIGPIYLTRQ